MVALSVVETGTLPGSMVTIVSSGIAVSIARTRPTLMGNQCTAVGSVLALITRPSRGVMATMIALAHPLRTCGMVIASTVDITLLTSPSQVAHTLEPSGMVGANAVHATILARLHTLKSIASESLATRAPERVGRIRANTLLVTIVHAQFALVDGLAMAVGGSLDGNFEMNTVLHAEGWPSLGHVPLAGTMLDALRTGRVLQTLIAQQLTRF